MPAIRELNRSYFALVMATGIVARATRLDDVLVLSDALLATALLAFVVMSGLAGARRVGRRRRGDGRSRTASPW